MKIENVEQMDEKHYRKGFDTHLNEEYRRQLASGAPEFTIGHKVTTKDSDEVAYELKYRRDDSKDEVYLNTIKASLSPADAPGQVREHTFTDDSMITAGEMIRMLKYGDKVAVNKNLFNKEGEPYNAWLSLDIKGTKDDYGNYPVNSYHQNYFKKEPFIVSEKLKDLIVPVKETGSADEVSKIEKALKKADLYPVTIYHNDQETKGFLSVNPKERLIDVLDANMALIERQVVRKALPEEQKNDQPAQKQDDLKKKPQPDQQVTWTKGNQSKGISH